MDRVKPVIIQRVTSFVVVHESLSFLFLASSRYPFFLHLEESLDHGSTLVHIIVSTYTGVAKQNFLVRYFNLPSLLNLFLFPSRKLTREQELFSSSFFFFFLIIGMKKQLVSDVN